MDTETVVVTGFGPFRGHKINASWEAVRFLPLVSGKKYRMIAREIPVTYADVDTSVSELWKQFSPKLMVHVGVSSYTNKVTIEQEANRTGYDQTDCLGICHPTKEVCTAEEGKDVIYCQLNTKKICEEINLLYDTDVAKLSKNAGRYLCEYIYYKSLNKDCQRVLFIHVPELEKPFSAEMLTKIILEIIEIALKQINRCECATTTRSE